MRRVWLVAAIGMAGAACAPDASSTPSALALEIRIDQAAPGAVNAEGTVRVGMRAEEAPEPPGCHLLYTELRPLPEGAEVAVRMGGPVPLEAPSGVAEGAFGVLDRELAWTSVGLEAEAAGGWMIRERSAAQVPADPELQAVIVEADGSVTAHRLASGPEVSLEIDTAAGTWRCGGPGDHVTAPWWLTGGDTQRVLAVVERVERHRTGDGLEVVGRVRVRVPVDTAASAAGRRADRATASGARG